MPRIEAFIFDLDGVITDTAEYHYLAWKKLADEEGYPFTRADNDQLRGVSRRESLIRLLKGVTVSEETMQDYMQRKNDYYKAYLDQITPDNLLPNVAAFLRAAQLAGIRLGLGSASKNAISVLERLQMMDTFDAIGDGTSVVNPKPAPDLFVWVAGRLGVNPAAAIVFEDAEAGIAAALAGGFQTVGVGAEHNVQRAHVKAAQGLAELDVMTLLKHFQTV